MSLERIKIFILPITIVFLLLLSANYYHVDEEHTSNIKDPIEDPSHSSLHGSQLRNIGHEAGRTVFIGDGDDLNWIQVNENIVQREGEYLKVNDKGLNSTIQIPADQLTTLLSINSRVVVHHEGKIYLAFVRSTPSPSVQFCLMVSPDGGKNWEGPIVGYEKAGTIEGKCELTIHNDKIFFLTSSLGPFSYQQELSIKVTSIMNWKNISSVQRRVLEYSSMIVYTKISPIKDKVLVFWQTIDRQGLYFNRYENGTWDTNILFNTWVHAFCPVSSSIDGVPAIFLFYTKSDRQTIYMARTDGGPTWSREFLVGQASQRIEFITGISGRSEIHLAFSYESVNMIGYGAFDLLEILNIKSIAEFSENERDNQPKEIGISFDSGDIIVCYENSSGRIEYLRSSNGEDFSARLTFGDGLAHSPSMDESYNVICFMNGSYLEIKPLEEMRQGRIITDPIAPIGLTSWNDFGIEASGLVQGADIEFRIWDHDLSNQLFPEDDTASILTLGERIIENSYYRYGGELTGDWTKGNDVIDSIVLEIVLKRNSDPGPFLFSISMNYSTGFPYHEDFSNPDHILEMDDCLITPVGLELKQYSDQGWAILGPIELEEQKPDHLSAYCTFIDEGNAISFGIMDSTLSIVQGFEPSASSTIDSSGREIFINWQGRNVMDLPSSLSIFYIKVVIERGEGPIPIVNWLKLDDSDPPVIVGSSIGRQHVSRGESTSITIQVDDREDLDHHLEPAIEYQEPGSNVWESFMLSGPLWIYNKWIFDFQTNYSTRTGSYSFRAMVTDLCNLNSGWSDCPFLLEVSNNIPDPPMISVEPGNPSVNDVIDISLIREGSDLEDPSKDLLYNLYFFKDGLLEKEMKNLTDPSMTISDLDLKKGDIWNIEIRTWDGESESSSFTSTIDVANSIPRTTNFFQKVIRILEDELYQMDDISNWFVDDDGDTIEINMEASLEINARIDDGGLLIEPLEDFHGMGKIEMIASDGEGNLVTSITVEVLPYNDPPLFNHVTMISVKQDQWAFVDIGANDQRDDEDIEVVTNVMSVIPGVRHGFNLFSFPNGSFQLKVDNNMVGFHNITVRIMDSEHTLEHHVILEVENVNDPPMIKNITTGNDRFVYKVGEEIVLEAESHDPDQIWGDQLIYEWITEDGNFLGTGEVLQINLNEGIHRIDLIVTDSEGRKDISSVRVIVIGNGPMSDPPIRTWLLYTLTLISSFILASAIILGFLYARRRKDSPQIGSEGTSEESREAQETGQVHEKMGTISELESLEGITSAPRLPPKPKDIEAERLTTDKQDVNSKLETRLEGSPPKSDPIPTEKEKAGEGA